MAVFRYARVSTDGQALACGYYQRPSIDKSGRGEQLGRRTPSRLLEKDVGECLAIRVAHNETRYSHNEARHSQIVAIKSNVARHQPWVSSHGVW